jgi:hypothetical protein
MLATALMAFGAVSRLSAGRTQLSTVARASPARSFVRGIKASSSSMSEDDKALYALGEPPGPRVPSAPQQHSPSCSRRS